MPAALCCIDYLFSKSFGASIDNKVFVWYNIPATYNKPFYLKRKKMSITIDIGMVGALAIVSAIIIAIIFLVVTYANSKENKGYMRAMSDMMKYGNLQAAPPRLPDVTPVASLEMHEEEPMAPVVTVQAKTVRKRTVKAAAAETAETQPAARKPASHKTAASKSTAKTKKSELKEEPVEVAAEAVEEQSAAVPEKITPARRTPVRKTVKNTKTSVQTEAAPDAAQAPSRRRIVPDDL